MKIAGLNAPAYPPRGAIVVTRTTKLFAGKPAATGPGPHLGAKAPTHVTVMLPGDFATYQEAHAFIGLVGRGNHKCEMVYRVETVR